MDLRRESFIIVVIGLGIGGKRKHFFHEKTGSESGLKYQINATERIYDRDIGNFTGLFKEGMNGVRK